MQRFKINIVCSNAPGAVEDPEGYWVRFTDAEKENKAAYDRGIVLAYHYNQSLEKDELFKRVEALEIRGFIDRRKGERRGKDRRIGHDPSYDGYWRRNLGSGGRRTGKDRRQGAG